MSNESSPASPEIVELEPGPAEAPPLPPKAHAKAAHEDPPAPLSVQSGLPPRQWPPVVVGDLMTRNIIAVEENEKLGDLEGGMKRFRFRHLPVVREGKLVGLITRTDFLHAVLGTAPDGSPISGLIDETTLAGSVMRRTVITAKMTTPLADAARTLIDQKIGCVPVVLDDHTLVGILTETDMVRLSLELLEWSASKN